MGWRLGMVSQTIKACRNTWTGGTFKRELAVIQLGFLALMVLVYLGRVLVFTPSDPAMVAAIGTAFSSVFSVLATMIISFAGLAFGLDAWAKQLSTGPKP